MREKEVRSVGERELSKQVDSFYACRERFKGRELIVIEAISVSIKLKATRGYKTRVV